MKHFLLPALLLTMTATGVYAQSKLPEKLYVVGSFTGWKVPLDGGTDYVLSDEDGDGIYKGSFEINDAKSISFKIFSEVSNWTNSLAYMGSYSYDFYPLYSNVDWTIPIGSEGKSDIRVNNWEGGMLNFEVKYEPYEYSPEPGADLVTAYNVSLTLSAPNQPELAKMPEYVYAIGDFNDWKLPDEENLNGALRLEQPVGGPYDLYWNDLNIPAGTKEFMFYSVDPTSNAGVYYGNPTKYNSVLPGFTLYYLAVGMDGEFSSAADKDDLRPFQLTDWKGTRLSASLNLELDKFRLGALDGPQFVAPTAEETYIVYRINDGEPQITKLAYNTFDYIWEGTVFGTSGIRKLSYFFTTENSVTPDPANCWGAPVEDPTAVNNMSIKWVSIIKGTNTPIVLNYPANSDAMMNFQAYLQWGLVNISVDYVEIFDAPQIYLIGSPQGWDINDDSMPIYQDPTNPLIYEAQYDIEPGDVIFRFYTELGNWDRYSYGSQTDDIPVDVKIAEDGSYSTDLVEGKGTWKIPGWPGGMMRFRVSIVGMSATFYFTPGEGSVETIGMDPAGKPVYFNLQGQRIQNPDKGIYIRVTGGKSEKIIR